MVGFGSSLRMGRRTGWEGAYLDYETLKLLLSQIEAVYEEEGHWQLRNSHSHHQHHHHHHHHHRGEGILLVDGSGGGGGDSTEHSRSKSGGGGGGRGGGGGARDYRDELFLESDSDVAFASSASDVLSASFASSGDEEVRRVMQQHHQHHNNQHHHHLLPTVVTPMVDPPGKSKQFSLSYSHEASSTEEDDESGTCGVVPMPLTSWVRSAEKSDTFKKKMQLKKQRMSASRRVDSEYFVRSAPDTFLIDDHHRDDDDGDDDDRRRYHDEEEGFKQAAIAAPSSLLKAPIQWSGNMNEQTALLGRQATTPPQSYYFGKEQHYNTTTPPRENLNRGMGSSGFLPQSATPFNHHPPTVTNTASSTTTAMNTSAATGGGGTQQKPIMSKWEAERKKQRRQRRLRRKKEMEKKVPRHLRIAHSKARAITERFLGLLRAEVEKCTLFAQARLGELADTAGSLRFPFFDDDNNNNNNEYGSFGGSNSGNHPRGGASAYEHPLSDGGLHPSASSSDEDGAVGVDGGNGLFPWSDSSNDDDSSNANKSSIVTTGSAGGGMPTQSDAHHHHRVTSRDSKIKSIYSFGKHEGFDAAQRQIAHFEELRRNQPVFQRNDRIVGEDLLLISAVDEADGYTAVGVELLHVLRYICLNMIAVRKICRKHDRLLMNRMLGGYYHRKQATRGGGGGTVPGGTRRSNNGKELQMQDVKTLGGILTQSFGDVCYSDNHYKLEGIYDVKIQHLASSTTVEGIASCLALALSEYEVSRSRADAIASLKDNATPKRAGNRRRPPPNPSPATAATATSFFGTSSISKKLELRTARTRQQSRQQRQSNLDLGETGESSLDGAPSSSSSISIARLRFTMVSIYALREAVRVKLDSFNAYLARSLMAFSGHAVIGEGLEGCSRETLDFLVSYNPDAALLLDSAAIYNGLKRGNWRRCPVGHVMIASLAAGATTPASTALQCYSATTEHSVMQALSVLPKPQHADWPSIMLGCSGQPTTKQEDFDYIPPIMLQLQRVSVLLFSMNYFVAHATANTFVKAAGAQPAYSAAVIGMTNVGAITSSAFQCYRMSRQPYVGNQLQLTFAFFRRMFLLAASMAIMGNIVCALAIQQGSIPLVLFGRFLIGMGCAELIHRQLISRCLPAILVVSESACYIQFQVIGRIIGISTGALAQCVPIYIQGLGFRSLQSSSWLMALLWLVHGLRVLVKFKNHIDPRDSNSSPLSQDLENQLSKEEESSSDSSSDDGDDVHAGIMRSSSRTSRDGGLAKNSKPDDRDLEVTRKSASGTDLSALRIRILTDSNPRKRRHPLKTIVVRVGKVLTYKVAVSVAMVVVVCTAFAQEVLFASCSIIYDQYFNWSGAAAGFFMGSVMTLVLPIDFICEHISLRYEERTVVKRAISLTCMGLLIMINWSSITSVLKNIRSALSPSWSGESHPYDWKVGIFQYTIGFLIAYGGIVALEGATLSLLSKVSLAASKNPLLNMATLVTFFSLFARMIGDIHILIVGLSDLIINTDIVNSLVVPMLGACLVAGVLIRRHFFFLM